MLPKCGFIIFAVLFFLCSKITPCYSAIGASKPTPDPNWWKNGVFYQICLQSFQDSNDDGIGDFNGITNKFVELKEAGITAVYLSQIYESSNEEHSQGIIHFDKIHPEYGTMVDFRKMIEEAKMQNIKVILDFVLNHSSKRHQWFLDSEGNITGFIDFYVWRTGKDGEFGKIPPNNWLSVYGDSAWTFSTNRKQFYLHQFGEEQPDLNYANPKVKEAMKEVLKFWLDKGIDGFNLEAVPFLVEGKFEDEPKSNSSADEPYAEPNRHESLKHIHTMDQDETYNFIFELREFIDQYNNNHPDETPKILMSESYTTIQNTMKYYGSNQKNGVQIPFNFKLLPLNDESGAKKIVETINEWFKNFPDGQTPNWVIGRFRGDLIDNINILIASLPGVMITYNEEKIGQEYSGIRCKAGPRGFLKNNHSTFMGSDVESWLPVRKENRNIYKKILMLRQGGVFKREEVKVEALSDDVIEVTRGNIVVLINIGKGKVKIKASDKEGQLYKVVESTDDSIKEEQKIRPREVTIAAHKVIVFEVIDKVNSGWWKHAVIYQIYPRSFKDSNNDGDGDLTGIIRKLGYIKQLGVDVILLSSIYKSSKNPVDQGYDIQNFTEIDKIYGTMKEFDDLIMVTKVLGIKLVMDFVPNHSSNEHEWFIKSDVKEVREEEDYYIWKGDVKDDDEGPPNNWLSIFKGSAWTKGSNRKQYYLHQFDKSQPDLNYRNSEVKEKMKEILTFWLDKGVAGFRMGAAPYLVEDDKFVDEPCSNELEAKDTKCKSLRHIYTRDVPGTLDVIYDWRIAIDEYSAKKGGDEIIMITEANTDIYTTMYYYGNKNRPRAHFTFNFQLIEKVDGTSNAYDFAKSINEWIDLIPESCTSNWMLGNHDKHRVATRFGPENVDGLNMLIAVLPGVMITYNGEEIGQENGEVSWEQCQDRVYCNERTKEEFDKLRRDFQRTPFHWNSDAQAGFTQGNNSWLPVSNAYTKTNVAIQENQIGSHYELYKRLVRLRKQTAFVKGSLKVRSVTDYVLTTLRYYNGSESYFHLFNLGDNTETFNLKTVYNETTPFLEVVETNDHQRLPNGTLLNANNLTLQGHQSVIASFTTKMGSSSTTIHIISSFILLLNFLITQL